MPPGTLPVTAAVVSYNTRDHLDRCLASLAGESFSEILVVDNASRDGSASLVAERYPHVRLIANESNDGYAAAANDALRAAQERYVLLLNADTEVRPGAPARLAAYLDATPVVGIAAPRLEDQTGAHQASCFPFPGTWGWLFENAPLAYWTRRVPFARERSVTFRQRLEPQAVPWVLGAALLIRQEAALEVQGFEESYFMYYEEVDLCRRLARAGWETHHVPSAVVMHFGGASTSQWHAAMMVQRFRSTINYYHRYLSGWRRWFWTTLVRMGWAAHLVADSACLLVAREPAVRQRLREQRQVWWTAIFAQPVAVAASVSLREQRPVSDRPTDDRA